MDKKIEAIKELFCGSICEAVRKAEPMKIGEWRYGGGYLYYRSNYLYIEKHKVNNRKEVYQLARSHWAGSGIYDIM